MKYILVLVFISFCNSQTFGQSLAIEGFLSGKSVVMVSSAPGVEPIMSWEALAEEVHSALVEAGGDPVAYFELEDVVLTEEIQAEYASSFRKRLVSNIIIITRKPTAELEIHIFPFTNDRNIIRKEISWSSSAKDLEELQGKIKSIGNNRESENFLVIEVPEFFSSSVFAGNASTPDRFLRRNPLNLEVFKLGVPLAGSGGGTSYLTSFRYDLLGKTEAEMQAAQREEREGLEEIFEKNYPFQVEFLAQAKTNEELIRDRIQFILMRIEGRQGDLMESMQISPDSAKDPNTIVVKYYIKFLVRDELYIGSTWDADPNWRTALRNFLQNLQKK